MPSGVKPGMVPWKSVFAGAKWFHVTGITPALGTSAAEATREAMQAARAAGLKTSIDLNHRVKLWSNAEAGRWMTEFMQWCDVLVTTEEDTERVFGITGKDYEDVAAQLGAIDVGGAALDQLVQIDERLQDTALARAVRAEEQRQRSEIDALASPDALEVLDLERGQHEASGGPAIKYPANTQVGGFACER